ncbi:MAG TPA: hypothetical protein VGR57_15870 [Ktedonobacterales bacterium]|nr:hypothetical protein [Ktedonobacterales bacterium]
MTAPAHATTTAATDQGILPKIAATVFGPRAARLTERLQRLHWLSYLLILAQSAAVLIVLGHAELPLLTYPVWTIRALAAGGLFVLIATVIAADLAMLETLRRIPVLRRNRQYAQYREHLCYVLFVQAIEISTYAIVLAALESHPERIIAAAPLIPNQGPVFTVQIVLRSVLIAWTAIQLVIVRGKLPVLLSTLNSTGKEIIGAHVERRLAKLSIEGTSLPAAFRVYAAMSRPPRRIKTLWNGWLVARDLAREEEEERQAANIAEALDTLETHRLERPFANSTLDPTPDPSDPTGPSGRIAPAPQQRPTAPASAAAAIARPNVRVITRQGTKPAPRRADAGMSASQRQELEQRRIAACRKELARNPSASYRELARAIAMETHHRCNTDAATRAKAYVIAHPLAAEQVG